MARSNRRWLWWCNNGCGKHVIYIRKRVREQRGYYECSECGATYTRVNKDGRLLIPYKVLNKTINKSELRKMEINYDEREKILKNY